VGRLHDSIDRVVEAAWIAPGPAGCPGLRAQQAACAQAVQRGIEADL